MTAHAEPVGFAGRHRQDYRELLTEMRRLGLLDRQYGFYFRLVTLILGGWAAAWLLLVVTGDSWIQLLVAAFFGFLSAHTAFLCHDAGHRQIFRSPRLNDALGLFHGDLLLGMSYGWWVEKHNRHHTHPNQLGKDPDISIKALAFTPEQAKSKESVYRSITRHQDRLLPLLLMCEGVHIHLAGFREIFVRRGRRWPVEAAFDLVHVVVYLTVLFSVLEPGRALAFIVVHKALTGLYLGCVFAPNHKGMPVLDEHEQAEFLYRQTVTSRNLRWPRLADGLLAGVNFQIEHHLFPSMPRNNLRRAQPIVRTFCQQRGYPYKESAIGEMLGEIRGNLVAMARPLRDRSA
ncbi:MAG: acyl-CoA desaturase [Actinomycetota bacterium]|nr:acyl-CoA desaturase [Actinomycetota bacterium]